MKPILLQESQNLCIRHNRTHQSGTAGCAVSDSTKSICTKLTFRLVLWHSDHEEVSAFSQEVGNLHCTTSCVVTTVSVCDMLLVMYYNYRRYGTCTVIAL